MSTAKVLSPASFVHIVLRTTSTNFPKMRTFYKTFLGADASYENDFVSFLSYDEEHHRIAIIGMSDLGTKQEMASGLDHFAFAFNSLRDLSRAYQDRKAIGIIPVRCLNHGPTTSMYYKDPDGNSIELQVDNMDKEGATAFMNSAAFAENFVGIDFDPEIFCKRIEVGEDEAQIMRRPDA